MERITRTFREIVRTGLPLNADGLPSVYGEPIRGWFHGDRQLVSNDELPAIAFDSQRRHTEFGTFRARDHDWQFSIICYVRLDHSDFSTTMLHEMARLVDDVISRHTRVWVFDRCIFCLTDFVLPSHLTTHSAYLSSYVADVRSDWLARWNATHQVQGTDPVPTAPVLVDDIAYPMGYYRLFESGSVATGGTFSFYYDNLEQGLSTPNQVLEQYKSERRRPVRLLSFTRVGDIDYGVVPKMGQMYLRGAELRVSVKEIEPLTQFTV